ncbi:MAG: ABC transporter ATP-binding protein [Clostridia bacterium]|nr:ABC transporter ATP-binding protein [Clostridia bacterium]
MDAKNQSNYVLELKSISKSFQDNRVLNNISLSIREGEFVTLLGASGCGKTTILRIIAGLEYPDSGEVILEGKNMLNIAPEKRNVNMVFQNYALFPHMNVQQNIGYSLKLKGVKKDEIKKRTEEMLKLVQMEGFEKRMPSQMSGGQKQRVAIARALINNPKVLLLDEPLGALDLQLRRQMQLELKKLQKNLGITFVYITHDQEEAINMSDRIAVMRGGVIEQVGTPSDVYDTPVSSFVARFVGSSNILSGKVIHADKDTAVLERSGGKMLIGNGGHMIKEGETINAAIRGEVIRISREENAQVCLSGVIQDKSFAGGMLRIQVLLPDGESVIIRRHGINIDFAVGERVFLEWDASSAVPVDRNK